MVGNREKQNIEESDVGAADEILDLGATVVEPSESIPEGEVVEKVVGKNKKKKIGALWSPLEDQKVYAIVQKLKAALLTIPKSEVYRAEGKSPYCGFRVGPRRTFANIFLSPKRGSCRVGRHEDGKTDWKLSFKISDEGITQNGDTVEISDIVLLAKSFVSEKGWA